MTKTNRLLLGSLTLLLMGLCACTAVTHSGNQSHPQSSSEITYQLTVHVKDWIEGSERIKSLPLEVIQESDDEQNPVAAGNTNDNGTVTFSLPPGIYVLYVSPGEALKRHINGSVNVDLEANAEIDLKLNDIEYSKEAK